MNMCQGQISTPTVNTSTVNTPTVNTSTVNTPTVNKYLNFAEGYLLLGYFTTWRDLKPSKGVTSKGRFLIASRTTKGFSLSSIAMRIEFNSKCSKPDPLTIMKCRSWSLLSNTHGHRNGCHFVMATRNTQDILLRKNIIFTFASSRAHNAYTKYYSEGLEKIEEEDLEKILWHEEYITESPTGAIKELHTFHAHSDDIRGFTLHCSPVRTTTIMVS